MKSKQEENEKRAFGYFMWGFFWLILQIVLIYLFIKTGIIATIIPLPLFLAFKSFKEYFRLS